MFGRLVEFNKFEIKPEENLNYESKSLIRRPNREYKSNRPSKFKMIEENKFIGLNEKEYEVELFDDSLIKSNPGKTPDVKQWEESVRSLEIMINQLTGNKPVTNEILEDTLQVTKDVEQIKEKVSLVHGEFQTDLDALMERCIQIKNNTSFVKESDKLAYKNLVDKMINMRNIAEEGLIRSAEVRTSTLVRQEQTLLIRLQNQLKQLSKIFQKDAFQKVQSLSTDNLKMMKSMEELTRKQNDEISLSKETLQTYEKTKQEIQNKIDKAMTENNEYKVEILKKTKESMDEKIKNLENQREQIMKANDLFKQKFNELKNFAKTKKSSINEDTMVLEAFDNLILDTSFEKKSQESAYKVFTTTVESLKSENNELWVKYKGEVDEMITTYELKLKAFDEKIGDIKTVRNKFIQEQEKFKKDSFELQSSLNKIQLEKEQAINQLTLKTTQIAEKNKAASNLEQSLSSLKDLAGQKDNTLHILKSEKQQLQSLLDTMKVEKNEKIKSLELELKNVSKESKSREQLNLQIEQLKGTLAQSERENISSSNILTKKTEAMIKEKENEIQILQSSKENLNIKIKDLENDISKQSKKIETLQNDLSRAKDENIKLQLNASQKEINLTKEKLQSLFNTELTATLRNAKDFDDVNVQKTITSLNNEFSKAMDGYAKAELRDLKAKKETAEKKSADLETKLAQQNDDYKVILVNMVNLINQVSMDFGTDIRVNQNMKLTEIVNKTTELKNTSKSLPIYQSGRATDHYAEIYRLHDKLVASVPDTETVFNTNISGFMRAFHDNKIKDLKSFMSYSGALLNNYSKVIAVISTILGLGGAGLGALGISLTVGSVAANKNKEAPKKETPKKETPDKPKGISKRSLIREVKQDIKKRRLK